MKEQKERYSIWGIALVGLIVVGLIFWIIVDVMKQSKEQRGWSEEDWSTYEQQQEGSYQPDSIWGTE